MPVLRNQEPRVDARSYEPGTRCGCPVLETKDPLWMPTLKEQEPLVDARS